MINICAVVYVGETLQKEKSVGGVSSSRDNNADGSLSREEDVYLRDWLIAFYFD